MLHKPQKLPKEAKIAKSGHTDVYRLDHQHSCSTKFENLNLAIYKFGFKNDLQS